MWSPQGTYLTTFHVPGIALWGGERFEKQGRFPHKDVKVCPAGILTKRLSHACASVRNPIAYAKALEYGG